MWGKLMSLAAVVVLASARPGEITGGPHLHGQAAAVAPVLPVAHSHQVAYAAPLAYGSGHGLGLAGLGYHGAADLGHAHGHTAAVSSYNPVVYNTAPAAAHGLGYAGHGYAGQGYNNLGYGGGYGGYSHAGYNGLGYNNLAGYNNLGYGGLNRVGLGYNRYAGYGYNTHGYGHAY